MVSQDNDKSTEGHDKQGMTFYKESSTSSQTVLVFSQPFAATTGSAITIAAFYHSRWDNARTAGTHQASKHTC